jgi:hypothetical protein
MAVTEPTAFQMRVTVSIGVMFFTPCSRPTTGVAIAPSSVSSAVGTMRVPSLSLRRLMRMPFRSPWASRVST